MTSYDVTTFFSYKSCRSSSEFGRTKRHLESQESHLERLPKAVMSILNKTLCAFVSYTVPSVYVTGSISDNFITGFPSATTALEQPTKQCYSRLRQVFLVLTYVRPANVTITQFSHLVARWRILI